MPTPLVLLKPKWPPVMQSDRPWSDNLTKKWAVNSLLTPDLKINPILLLFLTKYKVISKENLAVHKNYLGLSSRHTIIIHPLSQCKWSFPHLLCCATIIYLWCKWILTHHITGNTASQSESQVVHVRLSSLGWFYFQFPLCSDIILLSIHVYE